MSLYTVHKFNFYEALGVGNLSLIVSYNKSVLLCGILDQALNRQEYKQNSVSYEDDLITTGLKTVDIINDCF